MQFKVGDKVKYVDGICEGLVKGVVGDVPYPYYVDFGSEGWGVDYHDEWPGFQVFGLSPCAASELELVQ